MLSFRSKKYREKMDQFTSSDRLTDAASQWIMRRDQLPEYRFALEWMNPDDKESVFWREWDTLDELAQRDLARATFSNSWQKLVDRYAHLNQQEKIQVLEALGYIHQEDVVAFLINELKRDDESLRLAAASALKRQDPLLTVEPMLEALSKPEVFLASRVYDVLKAIGPKLVPVICHKIIDADNRGRMVMVQLLGAFGDETILPILEQLAKSRDYELRKAVAEAIVQIGGEAALPLLSELIHDESWQIRLLATEGIREDCLTDGLFFLRQALHDEKDFLVRDMIQDTIVQLETIDAPAPSFSWCRERKEDTPNNEEPYHSRTGRRHKRYTSGHTGKFGLTGNGI